MPQETAPYRIARSLRRESFYPIVQGYKNTAAVGMRFNFSDPVQLNRANVTLALVAVGRPVQRAGASERRVLTVRLARTRRMEQGGLLRFVRSHQDQSQGLRRWSRASQHAPLRRAAASRARSRRRSRRESRSAARSIRTLPSTSTGCIRRVRSWRIRISGTRSGTSMTRQAVSGRLSPRATTWTAPRSRSFTVPTTAVGRLPPTRRSGFAMPPDCRPAA